MCNVYIVFDLMSASSCIDAIIILVFDWCENENSNSSTFQIKMFAHIMCEGNSNLK